MAQPESAVVNGLNWSLELQFGVQWSSSNGNNSNSSSSWYGNPDRGTPLMLETWCLCGFLCNSPWELGGVAIVQVSLRFRWQLRIESFNRRDPIQQLQHVDHRSTDPWFSVFSFSFLFRLQSQSQAHLHTHVLICSLTQILTYSDTHIGFGLDWIGSASISQLCMAFGVWKLLQSLNARSTHDPHGWRSIISGVTEPLKPGAWPIYRSDRGVNGGGTQNRFPLSNGALELEFYLKHSYLIYFLMYIINCHWIVGNLLVSNTIFS